MTAADTREVRGLGDVEQHRVRLARERRVDRRIERLVVDSGEREHVDEPDLTEALQREVTAQIGLLHRGDGMPAHRRMAVEPVRLAAAAHAGKQVAEHAIAPEARLATDHGDEFVAHMTLENAQCRTEAADGG